MVPPPVPSPDRVPVTASPALSPVADTGVGPVAPAWTPQPWSPDFPDVVPNPSSNGRLTRPVVSEWTQIFSKVDPQQLLGWMLSADQGNWYAKYMIVSRMERVWPKFAKNFHELREAVSRCKYVVVPYSDEGEQPTESAKEKAKLFSRCLKNFSPNPASDERGFHETLYDLAGAAIIGVSVQEILWKDNAETESGMYEPKATAWVFTPHMSFLSDGTLGVGSYEQYQHWTPGNARPLDPNRFMVAQYQTRSGPSSTFGLAQTLMWWWMATTYARDWMFKYAQIFGSPMRWATYQRGAAKATIDAIERALRDMGYAGYGAFPEGSNLQLIKDSGSAASNPQAQLMQMADTYCDLMVLGQTLSSNSNKESGGGSRALGQVHENTKQERIMGVASWLCSGPLDQLTRAWSRINYGNEDELPTVRVDTTQVEDPVQMATRDQILLGVRGFVMPRQWLHDRHGVPVPKAGDEIVEGAPAGATDSQHSPESTSSDSVAPTLQDANTTQAREMLHAALGNGDKHNRVYQFTSRPIFAQHPITAKSLGKGRSGSAAVATTTDNAATISEFRATQHKTMAPVLARLDELKTLPDEQFMTGCKQLLQDYPSLAKQVLQREKSDAAARVLAEAMTEAAKI